jgi:hypothetical protein
MHITPTCQYICCLNDPGNKNTCLFVAVDVFAAVAVVVVGAVESVVFILV